MATIAAPAMRCRCSSVRPYTASSSSSGLGCAPYQRSYVDSEASLKSALESNDFERIRATSDEVQQSMYRLSELLYQQSSQQYAGAATGGEPSQPGGESGDSDVIDAEYKAQ